VGLLSGFFEWGAIMPQVELARISGWDGGDCLQGMGLRCEWIARDSAKAASRGAKGMRRSADLAATGASVLGYLLRSSAFTSEPRGTEIMRVPGNGGFWLRTRNNRGTNMDFNDYKVVLCRNHPDGWVAEIPAVDGCYALMPTKQQALSELEQVFEMISAEYRDKGRSMPADTTEIVHAWRSRRGFPPRGCTPRIHTRTSDWQSRTVDGRAVTIPIHCGQEIGPPLYHKILRQLGITEENFRRLK